MGRATRRCGYFTALLCATGLVSAAQSWAAAAISLTTDMASGLVVGKRGVAGSITVTNTSTSPQSKGDGALVLASLTLVPSCGQAPLAADCPLEFRESGVISLSSSAIGAGGTACAGVPFSVSVVDAAQGKVQLHPSTPVLLSRASNRSPLCRVEFVFDVLKMPLFDADPGTAGIQTGRIAVASATHTDASTAATISAQVSTTISRADVTISGSADGGLVNTPTTDSATLTGSAGAPGLTGTIAFSLYGPLDATCAATPVFTMSKPVSGSGSYVSDPFTPTAIGTHRWIASYSGDASNAPASTACSDRGQAVAVRSAIVVTGPPSRTGRVGATLTGSVNTGGSPIATSYFFEYGPTTSYGSRTPLQPLGPGSAAVPTAAILTDLRAGTRYHYRLVATNDGGSFEGADRTLTTRPKAAAERLTVNVNPLRGTRASYRFAVRGKLVLPSSIASIRGCVGSVAIRVTAGSRTVATSRAVVSKRCNYARRVPVSKRAARTGRLKVTVSFLGNRVLRNRSAAKAFTTG